jgi:hypothetical protein
MRYYRNPQWETFRKPISNPRGNKQVHYTTLQVAFRKDVERIIGVLQSSFAIM